LQARLVGAERAVLRVRGDVEDLPRSIGKLKGVVNVTAKGEGTIEFEFAPGRDLRPEVAKLVINEGYDLLELRPVGLSLEEIFLELTSSPNRSKGAAA
jgi:ABC-2 type transport system ATP-binding protein